MKNFFNNLYRNAFLGRFGHTLVFSLQKELLDCQKVLDIGCGPDSPLKYCRNVKYSLGVEPFGLYFRQAKEQKIHTEYLNKKIENLDFPQNCFDAVILIEVLEHLPKEAGLKILQKAEEWAEKKIVVSTPNGFLSQGELDGNKLQKHLSGWSVDDFKKLGFKVTGRAGLKFLRRQAIHKKAFTGFTTSLKYRPRAFWFLVAALSQTVVYHHPRFAFELFCVKNLSWKK